MLEHRFTHKHAAVYAWIIFHIVSIVEKLALGNSSRFVLMMFCQRLRASPTTRPACKTGPGASFGLAQVVMVVLLIQYYDLVTVYEIVVIVTMMYSSRQLIEEILWSALMC